MKGAIDRIDTEEESAVSGAVVATSTGEAGGAAEEPEPPTRRGRAFDDIPSVVRALLLGYDEA